MEQLFFFCRIIIQPCADYNAVYREKSVIKETMFLTTITAHLVNTHLRMDMIQACK